jgi:hypothetical protein
MSATLSEALLALALVQTALLVSCAIAVRARTDVSAVKGELIVWCLGMVGIALWGHGLGSTDVYAYAAYAKSGFACYQGVSFTGSPFAVLNVLWGNPTVPCVYGPVLSQTLHAVAGWTYAPLDTVTVIRLLDGVAFVGLIITLLAFNTRLDVATTIALDGALYVQFVTDGHADILCILPIFLARLAFMHGAWRRGIVLASIAISMKIVLVIVAPLAVVGLASTKKRFIVGAAIVAVGVSWYIPLARDYIEAFERVARIYASNSARIWPFTVESLVVASIATILALIGVRRWALQWSYLGIAQSLFPWYLAWSIPYVFIASPAPLLGSATYPIVTYLLSTVNSRTPFSPLIQAFALLAGATLLFWSLIVRVRQVKSRGKALFPEIGAA